MTSRVDGERPKFRTNAPPIGHSPPLDGVRGISVLLILLVHASYYNFESLAVMVDFFFAVSGFLITTLLYEQDAKKGSIDLKEFYWRRVFRLLPAMFAVVLGSVVLFLIFGDTKLRRDVLNDALAALTYMYHVVHPVASEIATSSGPPERPLLHLWSLSVEEHFYFFGVFLVIGTIRFRAIRTVTLALGAAWALIAIARATGHVGPRFAWYQRPDSLMIGVIVANIHAMAPRELPPKAQRLLTPLAYVATAVIALTIAVGIQPLARRYYIAVNPLNGAKLTDGLYWGEFGFSVCNLAFGIALFAIVRVPGLRLTKILSWKPFQALGIRSYSLYLIHVPLAVLLIHIFGESQPALAGLLYLVLLPIGTELLHKQIEQRYLRKGRAWLSSRNVTSTPAAVG